MHCDLAKIKRILSLWWFSVGGLLLTLSTVALFAVLLGMIFYFLRKRNSLLTLGVTINQIYKYINTYLLHDCMCVHIARTQLHFTCIHSFAYTYTLIYTSWQAWKYEYVKNGLKSADKAFQLMLVFTVTILKQRWLLIKDNFQIFAIEILIFLYYKFIEHITSNGNSCMVLRIL